VIDAKATVTFSTQPPLDTPRITNTVDAGSGLTSSVAPLPTMTSDGEFHVSWSGSDAGSGSGSSGYTVYVSKDGGAYTPFLVDTPLTSATYAGEVGHSYKFYTVATDYAGNVQAPPVEAQAGTDVATVAPLGGAPAAGGEVPTVASTAAQTASSTATPTTGSPIAPTIAVTQSSVTVAPVSSQSDLSGTESSVSSAGTPAAAPEQNVSQHTGLNGGRGATAVDDDDAGDDWWWEWFWRVRDNAPPEAREMVAEAATPAGDHGMGAPPAHDRAEPAPAPAARERVCDAVFAAPARQVAGDGGAVAPAHPAEVDEPARGRLAALAGFALVLAGAGTREARAGARSRATRAGDREDRGRRAW
jgi:hypothetical protein